MNQDIVAAVRRVVHQQLGIAEEDIAITSSFTDDLGADSLQLIELTLALEAEFGVTIDDEDARSMRTLGDAIRFIESPSRGRSS